MDPGVATRRRRTRVLAAGIYAALALWMHRHLLPALGSSLYDQRIVGHDSLLHVWALAWGQHALATDPTHVFDAPIFHPSPGALLFSDHLLGLAVLLAPLRLLTDDVVLLHNLVVVASPLLNALAAAALAREVTGSRVAAFAGGLVYAFAPFRASTDLNQIQMLVAWWPPLVLLAARRALATGRARWALLAAVALAAQGSTGIYLTAYFLPFLALAHLWWLRVFPPSSHRRGWARLLGAEAAAALALAPTAFAYRGVQAVLGSTRSPVLNALLSTPPTATAEHLALLALAVPVAAGILLRRRLPPSWRGELPLVLAIAFGAIALALGPMITLPFGLGRLAGPYALLMGLPGFDALRAPGRMLHVAVIGVALLAGGGVAALRAALPRQAFHAVALAVLVAFAWQAHPDPPLVTDVPRHPPDSVYAWLRDAPGVAAIAEIPFGRTARNEQDYQYAGILHWRPMANGNLGVKPMLHGYLTRRLGAFPDPTVLADLKTLGVTHVVVHERGLGRLARQALATALRREPPPLVARHRRHGLAVYEIAALPAPGGITLGTPIARSGWRVTTSENGDDAPAAIDDAPHTAWSSWGALEDALAPWWAPRPFLDLWRGFVARQPVRVAVDLGGTETIGAVSLRLPGSDPEALPQLRLDVSDDGTEWRRLHAALVAVPDVGALVRGDARLAFVLEPPVRAGWVRVQCRGLEWRLADLAVHGPP